jgi:hypothetical protein
LKFWNFAKNHTFDPVLDDKNNYVGYYEIDDIMSFSPDSIFKRTWKNNKIKKLDYSYEPDYANCRSNNGNF